MIEITLSNSGFTVEDQSSIDILKKGYIGTENNKKRRIRHLTVYETLYLIEMRNARCVSNGKEAGFSKISKKYTASEKFMAKYLTYRDWRERGLIIREPDPFIKQTSKPHSKSYPSSSLSLPKQKIRGIFFNADLMSIIEDREAGQNLYESFWLGQYGSYKASDRGKLSKLDIYETLFLVEEGTLTMENASAQKIRKLGNASREDFDLLYEVYKDWRKRGYVIKTGFKFGTHFRIYFPGARPVKSSSNDWVHSKHVIHVFPRESRLLISEWARAIRVAHSVRKTFVLAIPGKKSPKGAGLDFVLYHRKGSDAENPDNSKPRYAMLSLGEEEHLSGSELAGAIKSATSRKLDLIVAIADRETAVTYYKVRRISFPKSVSEYYEIDWMQP